ncbi:MAG: hypothetical protein U9P61_02490 [Patescibacteria group bacterium]|nr:hypothetical protein [Patescibacteria group bacterium]
MIKKNKKRINGTYFFITIVLFSYLILFLTNNTLFNKSLEQFFSIVKEITPLFIIVFVLMFVFNLFLTEKRVAKILGESAGAKGWLISIIGGILSMGPVYIWYPLLSDLQKKGMKNSFIVTFLYNRAIKLPLLPMMAYYFGVLFAVVLTSYMIIFSIINGLLVNKFLKYENSNSSKQ